MTPTFVDPRSHPDPGTPRPPARFTGDAAELKELHRLCRDGRLYDVERWIRDGHPLQLAPDTPIAPRRRTRTALGIAFARKDHSLVHLLLANGYDLDAEPRNPLNAALGLRRQDIVELLLGWGADLGQVCLETLCDTYDSDLYERFRNLGVDLTADHSLARALGHHTSNKPLFGFAKRHRPHNPAVQYELDLALAYHAGEGNEKGVLLSLWAGADPHAPVPHLEFGLDEPEGEEERSSAVHEACCFGHSAILEHLQPHPARDDYDELYRDASNDGIVEILARSALPRDPSKVIISQLVRLDWPFPKHRPIPALRALFEAGVRWEASPGHEIADARRSLLKQNDRRFLEILKLLATDGYCSREVLTELARTPAMRERMRQVELIPPTWKDRSEFDRTEPPRGRAILARFGIEPPEKKEPKKEPAAALPTTVHLGHQDRNGTDLRLDRRALYERVWSTPVYKLAEEWGLSDRGLAKACHRLRIPVPPRGYWARVHAGQRVRRPRLPKLPAGQAETILIRVPTPSDTD